MRTIIAAALAAGVALTGISAAEARDNCGSGFHRGPYGHCRPNGYDRRPVVTERLVIGNFYRDRGGYWDGRRYWRERYRYHNGWRYR